MGAVAKRNMARSNDAMTLYSDSSPDIKVCCDGNVLKANVGRLPIGTIIQIVGWLCFALFFTLVFGSLLVYFSLAYLNGAEKCGWCEFLLIDAFFVIGTVGAAWMVKYLADTVLPYTAEIFIDAKLMVYGNKLWRRKCNLADEVSLLIEPNYTKGDWGFALKIVSGGRKHLLLSGVFVGSYSKTISTARKLAKEIQKRVEYLRIEESRYWRCH